MPRTRISREDVHMRLMRKRSMESPLGSPAPGSPVPHAEPLAAEKVDGRINNGQSNVALDVRGLDREDERRLDTTPGTVDISAELAIIQTVEKRTISSATANVDGQEDVEHNEEDTTDVEAEGWDCETRWDPSNLAKCGLPSTNLWTMALKGSSGPSTKKPNTCSQVRMELVTEGIKTGQSSVNPSSDTRDNSMQTEIDMDLSMDDFRRPSFRSPVEEQAAPASPTKDAIRAREQLILEKRRQARRRNQEESVVYYTPPRPMSMPPSADRLSRRHTHSTGDASALTKSDLVLDIGISDTEEELSADSISKELILSRQGNEYAKQIREYRSQEKPIQEEPEPELDDSGNATTMACPFPAHLQRLQPKLITLCPSRRGLQVSYGTSNLASHTKRKTVYIVL
ncbi:hypothetical protein L210DRAFT_3672550 [Boletus edulis BED1]|uniref:Uncharacterized protein n=1 Tax=Boletus edulis BED1 TaxID=1328754 RepID=A0AAD4G6G9_BOLED|nr:hypothetical protein L210DRAFT_3672550 [Boletus edulis BED1]